MSKGNLLFYGIVFMILPIVVVIFLDLINFFITDQIQAIQNIVLLLVVLSIVTGIIMVCYAYILLRRETNKKRDESMAVRQDQVEQYLESKKKTR